MFVEVITEELFPPKKRRTLVLKCDQCMNIFKKRYSLLCANKEHHFCSNECRYAANKSGGIIDKKKVEAFEANFGNDHPMHNEQIKQKIKKTNKEKYGYENPAQSPQIMAKIKETNQRKYNHTCSLNDPTIRQKALDTFQERYGVKYSFQIAHVKEAIRKLKSSGCSKIEDRLYPFLCCIFGEQNVQRQVEVNNWIMDFYIRNFEVYVQLDGVYWHGLDRPLTVIEKCRTKHDEGILKTYSRDQKRDEWFKSNHLTLYRITDVEAATIIKTSNFDYIRTIFHGFGKWRVEPLMLDEGNLSIQDRLRRRVLLSRPCPTKDEQDELDYLTENGLQ